MSLVRPRLSYLFACMHPLELLPCLARPARSRVSASAMASNPSWRIVALTLPNGFHLVPFVVLRTEPPPHQTERCAWPQLVGSVETELEDQSEMFVSIQNSLIRLLDEDKIDAPLKRKGFKKQKNAKLPKCAFVWARLVNKLLLLMRNDCTGRVCSGGLFEFGA